MYHQQRQRNDGGRLVQAHVCWVVVLQHPPAVGVANKPYQVWPQHLSVADEPQQLQAGAEECAALDEALCGLDMVF